MPLLLTYKEPVVGIWQMDETPEELWSMLDYHADYVSFISQIRTEHRKKEWLAVRVLLKELLGEETLIAYSPNGAPYLPDKDVNISISHTKGYVAVILSDVAPVGIDIEYRNDRILKIKRKFINPDEEDSIDKKNEAAHLLIYWCAKEALFKMIGKEGVDFRDHLHITPFLYSHSGYLTATETRTLEKKVYSLYYSVYPDFVLTFGEKQKPG